MSRTNKERAFDAALAMASHSSRTGVHAEAADIQISDLLSNLMHLMDTQDLDQDECLDRAAMHYREEWAEEHKQFMGIPVVSDEDLPQSVRDTMAQIDTAMAAEKQEGVTVVIASGEPERTHMSINADGWAAIGHKVMDNFWPVGERSEQWCPEDYEETMISLICALRYYAEDVEAIPWQHLYDNGMDRFHSDIQRAECKDSYPENYPVPEEAEVCDWCTNDVPNGEGRYARGSDGGDRVCKGCFTIHTLRLEKAAWREQCRQVGHWATHIDFPVSDWKDEVQNDCTRQSYKDWVESQMEIRSDENE